MEKIYKRLFGEDMQMQEEKLKNLFKWSGIMLAVMVVLLFVSPSVAEAMIAVICLMWGWPVVKATAGVNKITELFAYNIVVFVIVLILWLCVGYLAGMVCLVLGIIRFFQIKKQKMK